MRESTVDAMKKYPTHKKLMETRKELKVSEGFDWLESTELAIDKRKFLLNRLYESSPFHQIKTRPTMDVTEFFISSTFVSIVAFQ